MTGPAQYRCSHCSELGHNRAGCPKLAPPKAPDEAPPATPVTSGVLISAPSAPFKPKRCRECGREFTPTTAANKFCSRPCSKQAELRASRAEARRRRAAKKAGGEGNESPAQSEEPATDAPPRDPYGRYDIDAGDPPEELTVFQVVESCHALLWGLSREDRRKAFVLLDALYEDDKEKNDG